MRGISFWFFLVAACCATIGIFGGLAMSIAQDHQLAPAHGHLNLVGWVSMAVFGTYYHLVPAAGARLAARVHFAVSTLGILFFAPGIVLAVQYENEVPVAIGSMLVIASMLIFLGTVIYDRLALKAA